MVEQATHGDRFHEHTDLNQPIRNKEDDATIDL